MNNEYSTKCCVRFYVDRATGGDCDYWNPNCHVVAGELDYGLGNYNFKSTTIPKFGSAQWGIGLPGHSIATTVGVFDSDKLVTGLNEWQTFRSDHPAGANTCFGDGSTRFVSRTTDDTVLDAFATIAGGEIKTID